VGRNFWWLFGRLKCLATSAYRQPLTKFPLTWSVKATGRCTTGRARMWYIYDGAPTYFNRAVLDALNNICHGQCIDRRGPTEWPPLSPNLNPLDVYMQLLLTMQKRFTITFWMPVTLSATTPASWNGCGGPLLVVSRHTLKHMENSLSTYKWTLLTITPKLNVSGHMLIYTFLVLVCGTHTQSSSAPFNFTLYNRTLKLNSGHSLGCEALQYTAVWSNVILPYFLSLLAIYIRFILLLICITLFYFPEELTMQV
jgi:hypothetical protein